MDLIIIRLIALVMQRSRCVMAWDVCKFCTALRGLDSIMILLVLGYAASAEATMLLLLTMPGLDRLRKGLVAVTRNALKPMLSVVPFCLFLLMDIYWKYELNPSCEGHMCSPSEHLRHQKSVMKSQRNFMLIASASCSIGLCSALQIW